MGRRLVAEWEPQDGVLLAWPHPATDWVPYLPEVEVVFEALVRHIARFERVLIAAADAKHVEQRLRGAGVRVDRVEVHQVPCNDTWARDFGPLAVEEAGQLRLLDFGFNGWGLKFASDRDNQITRRLAQDGVFRVPVRTVGLILEGGSVESDGDGTILTTTECLLGPNRNPHLGRGEIEAALTAELGAERFLWLENGFLAGDDTDSHVDTLARLCPDQTIAHVSCEDGGDEHFEAIGRMVDELRAFRTRAGRPFRLIPLPWPGARFDDEGRRLPATYANFLILNGAVLVPTYRVPQDDVALKAVGDAFPGREIIGVDCLPLILQHGSLHCVTLQLPEGALS